jgi:hypothetical protein
MISDLQVLEARYGDKHYPGKMIIDEGKKLLANALQQTTPLEFFKMIAEESSDLIDFAYDYDPIKAFFGGEQKTIFEHALDMLAIYDDSKTYIADVDLESIASQIRSIVMKAEPYKDIPKLPELREQFMESYMKVLQVQEAPVYAAIDEARSRTLEVLNGKPYVAEKHELYLAMFAEIHEESSHCNNVSRLRSYADRAEVLKLRLLNEMDQLDAELAKRRAEEEERKRKEAEQQGETPPVTAAPIVPQPKIKKKKNISIKSVALTSSWRIEYEEDIDKVLETLRKNLKAQLEEDTIVNVEF